MIIMLTQLGEGAEGLTSDCREKWDMRKRITLEHEEWACMEKPRGGKHSGSRSEGGMKGSSRVRSEAEIWLLQMTNWIL